MRRAVLLALAGASIVVAVLAIGAGERARPRSAGSPATPATRSGPAERPAGRCRQIPLPVSPDRPHALAADRHSLWVVGELTLYRYDLATPTA
jgi:hypothetical protein